MQILIVIAVIVVVWGFVRLCKIDQQIHPQTPPKFGLGMILIALGVGLVLFGIMLLLFGVFGPMFGLT